MTIPSSSNSQSDSSVKQAKRLLSLSRVKRFERCFGRGLFSTRWLMAPLYAGLVGGLLVVLEKFFQVLLQLLWHCLAMGFDDISVVVLDLVDLSFLANLLLIVMFSGYENYVSRLDLSDHDDDYPQWMGKVTFGDIKVKLMASIVAMSAIHLLSDFLRVDKMSTRHLAWCVGIHVAFVVSGVLIAVIDRLTEHRLCPSDRVHHKDGEAEDVKNILKVREESS